MGLRITRHITIVRPLVIHHVKMFWTSDVALEIKSEYWMVNDVKHYVVISVKDQVIETFVLKTIKNDKFRSDIDGWQGLIRLPAIVRWNHLFG